MATITGTIGDNSLTGSDADDNILGLAGNDTIKPGLGDDTVDGGDGKDTLVLDYSTASTSVKYTSDTTPATGSGDIYTDLFNNKVSFQNIEVYNITGSADHDMLLGGDFNDTLNGGLGNDTIYGGNGADVLNGGNGNDKIDGGGGADILDGGGGNDTLVKDLSYATANLVVDNTGTVMNFSDGTVAKNFENIDITLGFGNDTIKPGLGDDIVDGRSGIDTLVLNYSTSNYGVCYYGTDPASGSGKIDSTNSEVDFKNIEIYNITGSAHKDKLLGGDFNDTLNGGLGNDTINGGSGADILDGGLGNDTLVKNLFNATANLVVDNTGTVMNFSDGTIAKNFENIDITLGFGNDTIKPGLGDDIVDGRSGIDTLVLNYSTSNYGVYYYGTDPSSGSGKIDSTNSKVDFKNIEIYNITGSAHKDKLLGGDFSDILNGGAGNDTINGGAGNDTLTGGLGNDIIDGGLGKDLISESGNVNFVLNNTSLTGNGTDTLSSIETASLTGGSSSNSLNASSFSLGSVTLNGGGGHDTLIGGSKSDILIGGDGDDRLTGTNNGKGSIDTFTGGNGSDFFVLSNSTSVFYNDTDNSSAGIADYALITDFNSTQDKIQLEGSANNYLLGSSPIADVLGKAIYLDTNNNKAFNSTTDELIAIVSGSTNLNLTANYFVYS